MCAIFGGVHEDPDEPAQAVNPTPFTLHPKPYNLNPTPQSLLQGSPVASMVQPGVGGGGAGSADDLNLSSIDLTAAEVPYKVKFPQTLPTHLLNPGGHLEAVGR